jgi:hypothetical protein
MEKNYWSNTHTYLERIFKSQNCIPKLSFADLEGERSRDLEKVQNMAICYSSF